MFEVHGPNWKAAHFEDTFNLTDKQNKQVPPSTLAPKFGSIGAGFVKPELV